MTIDTPSISTPHNTPVIADPSLKTVADTFTTITLDEKEHTPTINEAFFGAVTRGNKWKKFLPIVATLVMDIVLPVALYFILKKYLEPVWALLIAGAPALIAVILKAILRRQLDIIGLLVFSAFAISGVIAIVTGDPRILVFEKSIVTAVMGVIFGVSLIPIRLKPRKKGCGPCLNGFKLKPLMFYLFKQVLPLGTVQVGEDIVESQDISNKYDWLYKEIRTFRSVVFFVTLLWSIGFMIEFIGRLAMVLSPLSLDDVVLYSNVFFAVVIVLLIIVTALYILQLRKPLLAETEKWMFEHKYTFTTTDGDALIFIKEGKTFSSEL